jgi:hypothetical protein
MTGRLRSSSREVEHVRRRHRAVSGASATLLGANAGSQSPMPAEQWVKLLDQAIRHDAGLITQRSQVQILPPLPSKCRSGPDRRKRRSGLLIICWRFVGGTGPRIAARCASARHETASDWLEVPGRVVGPRQRDSRDGSRPRSLRSLCRVVRSWANGACGQRPCSRSCHARRSAAFREGRPCRMTCRRGGNRGQPVSGMKVGRALR